jgi:hypothetical protein
MSAENLRRSIKGYRRTLLHFKVMFSGWECDDDGWVVELKDGRVVPVLSSHCALYIADLDELHEKLAEYQEVATDTEKAIRMVAQAALAQKDTN